MAITSGKQLGQQTMFIQAVNNESQSSSTASVSAIAKIGTIQSGISLKNTLLDDVLQTQESDGSLNDYTNPDLETVLTSIGFSTQRPEMLGAFEFQPFLDEASLKSSSSSLSSKSISTTAAAELADMHCQLKQLRYSEVMEFLEKYVGLNTKSVWTGTGIEFSTSSDDEGVLDDYASSMEEAKDIIDTLKELYNAILPVLESMQIKTNDYMGSQTSPFGSRRGPFASSELASTTISGTPLARIRQIMKNETYNNDWTESSVPGNISLEDYIKEYLGFKDLFWSSSSGNVVLTQLMLDIILRLFYPIYGYNATLSSYEQYREDQSGTGALRSGANSGQSDAVKGIGYVEETTDVSDKVSLLSHVNIRAAATRTFLDDDWLSESYGKGSSGVFSCGDFKKLWNVFVQDGDAGTEASKVNLGKALYIVGSDMMGYYARDSGILALDDYVEGLTSSFSASDIMKVLFGMKVGFSSKNLADVNPSKTGTCLAVTFPKNTDSTTSGKVASFTYSQKSLSQGTYPLRTGKSYFIDEIFTGEMSSVKKRLETFQDRLNQARSNILNTAEILKFPGSVASSGPGGDRRRTSIGLGDTLETTPSYLTAVLYKKAYYHFQEKTLELETSSTAWKHWCRLGVCILATEDRPLAWRLFKLYMAIYSVKDTGINMDKVLPEYAGWSSEEESGFGQTITREAYESRNDEEEKSNAQIYTKTWSYFNTIISDIAHRIINEHPGFKGPGEASTRGYVADMVNTPSLAFGDATDDDLSTAHKDSNLLSFQPPDGSYFSADHIEEALWDLVEEASATGESSTSPSSVLTFGFEGVDMFLQRVEKVYSSGMRLTRRGNDSDDDGLSISTDEKTPLSSLRYEGIIALAFFFQLQIWKSFKFMVVSSFDSDDYVDWQEKMSDIQDEINEILEDYDPIDPRVAYDLAELYTELEKAQNRTQDVIDVEGSTCYFGARAVPSLTYAVEESIENRTSPETITTEIEGDDFTSDDWDGTTGADGKIENYIDDLSLMYWKQVDSEANIWNSLFFVNGIIQDMYSSVSSLLSTLEGNNLTAGKFEEVFDSIRGNPSLKRALFLCVTRDQLSTNEALYDSLSVTNREYPYLPATKAVMTNQVKNLATISTLDDLVNTEGSGKKRILMIGIPAGFMDRLRNEAIDKGLGLSYFKSSVVSIEIWRRNMADDSEETIPREFKFDMSKFIIEGRAKAQGSGSEVLDAAAETEDGQTAEDIFNNTVVTTYQPEQDVYTTMGKAYSTDSLNSSSKGAQIFQNLVIDHYLKLYVKTTTGFDISEDIFPLQPKNIFFNGPDRKKGKLFKKLSAELAEAFPTRDVTSAINYDRILGEITRSVLIGPSKWANRVFYPKIFDRVFCVLIDEDEFVLASDYTGSGGADSGYDTDSVIDLTTGNIDYESSSSSLAVADPDERKPKYYQFFCTASILYPMLDEQSESEAALNPDTSVSEFNVISGYNLEFSAASLSSTLASILLG